MAKKKKTNQKAEKLTDSQKRFCELYCSSEEFYGNGVQSYIEAFDVKLDKKGAYNGAKSNAYKLLKMKKILEYINELLDERGLNDQFVDKQLLFAITQHADLKVKVKAISEYNKLKNRVNEGLKILSEGSLTINFATGPSQFMKQPAEAKK